MMTGDSDRTARAVASKVGVDEYYSEVLPEDKASFVDKERSAGRKVIMIGDGINDSPALSAADVGIAISDGAEIAREIADVTISADNLEELVKLKQISNGLIKRIHQNYRVIVGFNMGLIILGRCRYPPADHIRIVPQYFYIVDQFEEYDGSAPGSVKSIMNQI